MKELSREASQLVFAGREAFHPTEADRARVLAAVTGAATLTAGGVAIASSANLSLAGLRGLFRVANWGRLLAVTVPVAVGGTYWWQNRAPSPATAIAASPVNRPAPAVAPPKREEPPVQAAEQEKVIEQTSEPIAAASPERVGSPAADSKPGNQMGQEVALLSKAQTELSSGRPQGALEALAEHALRFPRGALTEERMATRVRTLCALGRKQEAQAELKRMERVNRSSAYLARAREACGSP